MHFDLKPIRPEGIPEALAKAELYRLLNEPSLAESICLDVLTIEPTHQQALIALLLARTDQFGSGVSAAKAREALAGIEGDYERAYYAGIIQERLGHTHLRHQRPGGPSSAYYALSEAMKCYEQAQAIRPPANDDAILRWNTCARVIMRNPEIRPLPKEEFHPIAGE